MAVHVGVGPARVCGGGMTVKVEREITSGMTAINPDDTAGTALVVYHPGLSDFPHDVANAFAEGLVARGWICS